MFCTIESGSGKRMAKAKLKMSNYIAKGKTKLDSAALKWPGIGSSTKLEEAILNPKAK